MRIVETYSPKYTVVFEHPDDGVSIHEFFVYDDNEPSIFADDDVKKAYNKEIAKNVWNTFNECGYWHTMTITAEYVIDGQAYTAVLCKEVSWADI